MNGTVLALAVFSLLLLVSCFFLVGELEEKYKQTEEEDKNKDNEI